MVSCFNIIFKRYLTDALDLMDALKSVMEYATQVKFFFVFPNKNRLKSY